ncbi:WbuC family cupin fold metalloprotein [Methylocaldum szegediense]|uniref:Cupin fold WbuC family metalloprotein n=1 Tax=Methylocaldum szegediense TaxID=73780 RepID=A0ABN8WZQ4_9GAMM|nr:WbuC family cupin fold metalloprotein [Methylocaldum szegediense]CAI8782731.1 Cupin fold WbuC family metalloprotein [Methylocaldum szegediense]
MDVLKTISDKQLIRLMGEASASPRLRKNLNIHSDYDDPIQRLFNAMEPGTYVRPHRHARPNGWELMLAVRGAFSIISFDDQGTVLERVDLSAAGGDIAAEIPPYTWHAIVVLAPETVMFEVKPGPYSPVEDKDFAAWAPEEGDPDAERVVAWYEVARPGERLPLRPSAETG